MEKYERAGLDLATQRFMDASKRLLEFERQGRNDYRIRSQLVARQSEAARHLAFIKQKLSTKGNPK